MDKFFSVPVMAGVLLLLYGALVIVKSIFGFSFPAFRIVFALFLVWLGLYFLIGPSPWNRAKSAPTAGEVSTYAFSAKTIAPEGEALNNETHAVSFGALTLDFRNARLETERTTIVVKADFGTAILYLGEAIPARITGKASFGAITLFGETTGGVSTDRVYETDGYARAENKLDLIVESSFGHITIMR